MATAKTTARTLLRANRKIGLSWRQISKYGYRDEDVFISPGVNPTTLCRFAKTKGAWQPKDTNILKLLGIYQEKSVKPKMLIDMTTDELLHALNHRAELTATHRKAAMNDFIRACRAASQARKAKAS